MLHLQVPCSINVVVFSDARPSHKLKCVKCEITVSQRCLRCTGIRLGIRLAAEITACLWDGMKDYWVSIWSCPHLKRSSTRSHSFDDPFSVTFIEGTHIVFVSQVGTVWVDLAWCTRMRGLCCVCPCTSVYHSLSDPLRFDKCSSASRWTCAKHTTIHITAPAVLNNTIVKPGVGGATVTCVSRIRW